MSPAGHRSGMEVPLRTVHGRLSPTRGRSCRHEPVIVPRCLAAWCYHPPHQWQGLCSGGHSTTVPQDPCQELEATDIWLRVLSEPTQNELQDTVFGFAVVPVLATVYYEAVRHAKSDGAEFDIPIILGCAIAHEIGHLLLGSNSHSGSGVMKRRWDRKQFRQAMTGILLFTPEQTKRIQAEAQTRMRLQTGRL